MVEEMNESNQKEIYKTIFFPESKNAKEKIKNSSLDIVHYTTAENVLKILKTSEFWLRDFRCLNDISEVQYGYGCLTKCLYGETGRRLSEVLNRIHNDSMAVITKTFDGLIENTTSEVYVGSFCLQDLRKKPNGMLSMWRAYGGDKGGAAICFEPSIFFTESNPLKVYASFIEYHTQDTFDKKMQSRIKLFEENENLLRALPRDEFIQNITAMFYFAIFSIKHHGFEEENELRLIHIPGIDSSKILRPVAETIHGLPQLVQKIKLKTYEHVDLRLSSIVKGILIGPTQQPFVLRSAFIRELTDAEVINAESKVYLTDIPLRR